MSEEYIVKNCAPTLAGLKTGNIYTCPMESRQALLEHVRQTNKRLRRKGVRMIPLRFSEKKALLYLFRPEKLRRDLAGSQAEELLRCQGYDTGSCEKCVRQLACRLRQKSSPPGP